MASHSKLALILRHLRSHNEATQQEVADSLHISRQALSSYETGRSIPPASELKRISLYYDFPAEVLFSLISSGQSNNPGINHPFGYEPASGQIYNPDTHNSLCFEPDSFFLFTAKYSRKCRHLTEGERAWVYLYHQIPRKKRIHIIRLIIKALL